MVNIMDAASKDTDRADRVRKIIHFDFVYSQLVRVHPESQITRGRLVIY